MCSEKTWYLRRYLSVRSCGAGQSRISHSISNTEWDHFLNALYKVNVREVSARFAQSRSQGSSFLPLTVDILFKLFYFGVCTRFKTFNGDFQYQGLSIRSMRMGIDNRFIDTYHCYLLSVNQLVSNLSGKEEILVKTSFL